MIENIRKYTGLMIVVLVLLFIGLVFLGDTASNVGVDKPIAAVSGKKYGEKDFRKLALNPLEIPSRIGDARNPFANMFSEESRKLASRYVGDIVEGNPYLSSPSGLLSYMNITLESDQPDRFLANRIAVQKAGIEYGASPGPKEVEEFIEGVLFADPDGNFDQAAYAEFLDDKIGSLGIGTRGFNEYIRDLLTAQNLSNMISGGVSIDRDAARKLFSNEKQSITAQQVSLESATYEIDQNPSEEDIKAYWEDHQSKYNTDERRKISYVFVEPDWDAALVKANEQKAAADEARKKQQAEAKKAEDEARKKLAEEAKKAKAAADKTNNDAAEKAPAPTEGAEGEIGAQGEPAEPTTPEEEAPAPVVTPATAVTPTPVATPAPIVKKPEPVEQSAKDQLTPQQKKAAIDALTEQINKFYDPLVDLSGATFEELAAEQKLKIITTELFAKSSPPKGLELRALNSPLGTLADITFAIPADAQDDQLISEPYPTTDGWFVGKLEETEASRPLTYEEAKVKATVDLKAQLAREQLKTEATALHAKLVAGVEAKKSFEDAAKESDLTVQKLAGLTIPPSRFGQSTIPPAFDAGRYTDPGSIAEIKFIPNDEEPESAIIVFVEKREVTVDDTFNDQLENFIESQNNGLRLATFQNWLKDRYTENGAEYYGTAEDQ
ncbi:hypothetical protein N9129_04445 [Akkermansiaceae bacterium]|nr:hypothetical protein [Akkermansiaceae bacterium]MDB4562702.1 hypothetical protein [Akkermansiaceae bacterium]